MQKTKKNPGIETLARLLECYLNQLKPLENEKLAHFHF